MEEPLKKFRYKSLEDFKRAINESPKKEWIRERDIGGGKKHKYLPIFVQQAIADVVFREFNIVDERFQVIVNEVVVTVKIQALPDYPHADIVFLTGSSSIPIQQDQGVSASKFPLGKKTNALQYNLPGAISSAIGNALEKYGNVFGRNVQRKVADNFSFNKKENEGN